MANVTVFLEKVYGWRGKAYGPGISIVPDDLASLFSKTGVNTLPPPPKEPDPSEPTIIDAAVTPIPETQSEDELPALLLINNAIAADQIAVLPGIGAVSGQKIIDNRPEPNGFSSLAAVAETVTIPTADWEEVADWSPE